MLWKSSQPDCVLLRTMFTFGCVVHICIMFVYCAVVSVMEHMEKLIMFYVVLCFLFLNFFVLFYVCLRFPS